MMKIGVNPYPYNNVNANSHAVGIQQKNTQNQTAGSTAETSLTAAIEDDGQAILDGKESIAAALRKSMEPEVDLSSAKKPLKELMDVCREKGDTETLKALAELLDEISKKNPDKAAIIALWNKIKRAESLKGESGTINSVNEVFKDLDKLQSQFDLSSMISVGKVLDIA